MVHQLRDARGRGGDSRIFRIGTSPISRPGVVDHVEDRQRLAVVSVATDVVERLLDVPLGPDAHVVRRHEPADAALGIAEQRHRDRPLLRRQQVQELARRRRGQLVEERGAVVGRHLVQDLRHLLGGHGLEQALLRLEREILEHVGGEVARQQAKGDHLLLHRQSPSIKLAVVGGDQCLSISWSATKSRARMTRARSAAGLTATPASRSLSSGSLIVGPPDSR